MTSDDVLGLMLGFALMAATFAWFVVLPVIGLLYVVGYLT